MRSSEFNAARALLFLGFGLTLATCTGMPVAEAAPDSTDATSPSTTTSEPATTTHETGTAVPKRATKHPKPKTQRVQRVDPTTAGATTSSPTAAEASGTPTAATPKPRTTNKSRTRRTASVSPQKPVAAATTAAGATATTATPAAAAAAPTPTPKLSAATAAPGATATASKAKTANTPVAMMSMLTAMADTVRRELTQARKTVAVMLTPQQAITKLISGLAAFFTGKNPATVKAVTKDDTFSGTENTVITGNVLANDTAPTGVALTVKPDSEPLGGKVILNTDGSFVYTPAAGFTGTDTFRYRAYAGSTVTGVVATVTVTVTPATVPGNPQTTKPVVGVQGLNWYVGLSPSQIDNALNMAKAANVTSVRMDFSWSVIESKKGTYDWSATDALSQAITAHGMTALAMVYDTPQWMSGSTDPHAVPVGNAQIQQFAQFAAVAAQRYGAAVPDWEVWNEQNIPAFWAKPNIATYTALLKATYSAIKAVAPGDTVIAGGLSPDPSGISPLAFVQGIYAAGGKGYFDALAYHQYAFPAIPTIDPLEAIHNVMVANGDGGKKIWITEAGAPTGTGSYAVTQQIQAQTVTAVLQQASQNSYIGPVYFYTIMDTGTNVADPGQNFGLITRNGISKPAYDALLAFMTGQAATTDRAISV